MLRLEEIEASIHEAAAGKSKRGVVRRTLNHVHERAEAIRHSIITGQWHPCTHKTHYIQEGSHRKRRNIVKPRWYHEQIVHHMLARQLAKIYGPRAYFYTAGTIKAPGARKGHGPLFCMRTVRRWRDEYNGKRFYVAELDIAKFFDSIDIEILESLLSKRIRDKKFLKILFEIIDAAGPGIPKGYYLSPWLAQIYLLELDNYVQQALKPQHYLRFVDNLFILHSNKRELHRMVGGIEAFLRDNLGLRLNGSKQVYRMEHVKSDGVAGRPINCLGYIIHHDRVTMRKSILKRARAKALRINRMHRCTAHDAATMISYKGWFKQTDTYRYYQRWISPCISMRYCRKKVSRNAKVKNEKEEHSHDRMAQGSRQPTGSAP